MDIFAMLQNATIYDVETEEVVGHTIGFEVMNGRMRFRTVIYDNDLDLDDEDDPDPEEEDVPDKEPEEAEAVSEKKLKLVAGGQK